MRVIAGAAKGVPLRSPSSPGTRPIGDRPKEALFSILMPRLPGSRFLDLFAGTGAVGIEALSRGAGSATFVEWDREALGDLRANLDRTRQRARARVVPADVFAFLRRPPEPFDLVFAAPPQWRGLWEETIRTLDGEPGWLADGGVAVMHCDPKEVRDVELVSLERFSARRYGNATFLFHGGLSPP